MLRCTNCLLKYYQWYMQSAVVMPNNSISEFNSKRKAIAAVAVIMHNKKRKYSKKSLGLHPFLISEMSMDGNSRYRKKGQSIQRHCDVVQTAFKWLNGSRDHSSLQFYRSINFLLNKANKITFQCVVTKTIILIFVPAKIIKISKKGRLRKLINIYNNSYMMINIIFIIISFCFPMEEMHQMSFYASDAFVRTINLMLYKIYKIRFPHW